MPADLLAYAAMGEADLTALACIVRDHVRDHWPNAGLEVSAAIEHGVRKNLPELSLVRAAPAEADQPWLQVTAGASTAAMEDGYGIELFLLTREPLPEALRLLAMIAHFHGDERYPLNLGQVLELGMPWLPDASCDHAMVVLPDLFGPEFEWHSDSTRTIRFVWLLPITASEAVLARERGHVALLQELGRAQADVTDPQRAAVA